MTKKARATILGLVVLSLTQMASEAYAQTVPDMPLTSILKRDKKDREYMTAAAGTNDVIVAYTHGVPTTVRGPVAEGLCPVTLVCHDASHSVIGATVTLSGGKGSQSFSCGASADHVAFDCSNSCSPGGTLCFLSYIP